MSFLAFILVSDEIEQLTNFNMLPCLFPKTDKLAEKRNHGVVLYKCIITDLGYQIEVEE